MAENETANQSETISPAAGEPPPAATPRRKKYSDGFTPKPKLPFAHQAAAIAFWAPLAGIALWLLSLFLQSSAQKSGDLKMQADIAFYLFGTEVILMGLALLMGGIALYAIRKHGKKGLLVRPLVGVAIALLFFGYVGFALYTLKTELPRRLAQLEAKLAGDWEIDARADNVPVTIRLSLRGDHTGSWKITGPKPVDLSGKWETELKDRSIILRLSLDAPQNQKVKVEGFLREVSDDQLTLANFTTDGRVLNQTFQRVK
jgi:hypothetical protein